VLIVEPQKKSAKSKPKRLAQLKLSSVKFWTDADPDMPLFATSDEFEIAKLLVLKACQSCLFMRCIFTLLMPPPRDDRTKPFALTIPDGFTDR